MQQWDGPAAPWRKQHPTLVPADEKDPPSDAAAEHRPLPPQKNDEARHGVENELPAMMKMTARAPE
jgi:hypothetical protein